MLITALRNDMSRPGKRLKNRPDETKRDKGGPSAKRSFLFVSVTIHLASANGIKVYPKRRVCIKYERFHLLLCI